MRLMQLHLFGTPTDESVWTLPGGRLSAPTLEAKAFCALCDNWNFSDSLESLKIFVFLNTGSLLFFFVFNRSWFFLLNFLGSRKSDACIYKEVK